MKKRRVVLLALCIYLFVHSPGYAREIYADKEMDDNYVAYIIPMFSNGNAVLYVQYSGKKHNSELLNASFYPENHPLEDGAHEFFLTSKENKKIKFDAHYKSGKEVLTRVTTDFSSDTLKEKNLSVFTLVSKGGYEIILEFRWKDDKTIDFVKVYPKIHPYKNFTTAPTYEDSILIFDYAMSLKDAGSYDKAEIECRKYIEEEPNVAEGWWLLGNILVKQDKDDDAIIAYKKALKLKPNEKDVLYAIGFTYIEKEQRLQALKYFLRIPGRKLQAIISLPLLLIVFYGISSFFQRYIITKKTIVFKDKEIGKKLFIGIGVFLIIGFYGSIIKVFNDLIICQYGPMRFVWFLYRLMSIVLLFFLAILQNWARVLKIALIIIDMIAIIGLFVFQFEKTTSVFQKFSLYERINALVGMFIAICFIYYFTRPKVKALFLWHK